jgi:FixJ family two-component response regulator
MPGMSGIELQERLIADGSRIPVIFVTAFPQEKLQGHVIKRGAIGYLRKPFDEGRLIECIDTALKSYGGRSPAH